ncbi:uncharacterized protein [Euwallacea fornicatus]|uniref:uncharacterized protein isoform X2 n=1 Tax=Euwallacea fornicatus TaxID=995702 RepID=UPI00338F04BC
MDLECELLFSGMHKSKGKSHGKIYFKMRFYRANGTYRDNPLDTEFGWYFEDIAIDEAATDCDEHNEGVRAASKPPRYQESFAVVPLETENGSSISEDSDTECDDLNEDNAKRHKIDFAIKEELPIDCSLNVQNVEGHIESPEENFYSHVRQMEIPPKEKLIALINPVNPETRALLSVISHCKYKSLSEQTTSEDVLRSLNFKATKCNHFITEKSPFGTLKSIRGAPDIHFQLSVDSEVDAQWRIISEIRNYHDTKEDNMLSLMMELVNTDLDSNFGDASIFSESSGELSNPANGDTSDIGTSIRSSIISKEDKTRGRHTYLDVPDRQTVLNSIGLDNDIDRSIETFMFEKNEMHRQLRDIRSSFEDYGKKVESLIGEANSLQNDLRETTYLTNLIHLLNGRLERVKNNKLPFRIFHTSSIGVWETVENLIL